LGTKGIVARGLKNPSRVPKYLLGLPIIKTREYLLQREVSNKDSKIVLQKPWLKVRICKERNAKFIVKGKLAFLSMWEGNTPISIYLEEDATLQIDGDFNIGNGVKIYVAKNGFLKIGGKCSQSVSGITCDSKIFVNKSVEIGQDFTCAWGVFISDCDWHTIQYDKNISPIQADVKIGDHVWISHDCSILKGTKIGNNCIVGCKSLLTGKTYPANSLLVGTPAKVLKSGCDWKYERGAVI